MRRCPYCMRPAGGDRCPHCGRAVNVPNAPHLLPVGFTINGGSGQSYQIGAVMGQGGFGITYIGLDCTLNRRVAVKECFPARCAQRADGCRVAPRPGTEALFQGAIKSFLEEARMLAALEDIPSLVKVRSYFEFGGTAYLVMEFLDGKPLHQLVRKNGAIPAEELMPKLPVLLRDLSLMHQAGVIHRDISPDNLMWMPDGSLKLLDFGCARSMEDGKSMEVTLKPGFAPVEQYQTHGQGPYTDIYALSATLYYCLTGTIPPPSVDRLEEDTLQPPTTLGARLTPEQEEALLWGMTVQPKSRPINMDVFAMRLLAVPKAGPKPVPEPGPAPSPGTGQEPPKKLKWWQVLLLIIFAGPLMGGALSLDSVRKKTGKRWRLLVAAALMLQLILGIVLSSGGGSERDPALDEAPTAFAGTQISKEPAQNAPADRAFTFQAAENGGVSITGYAGTDSAVTVPDTLDGGAVTEIGAGAFQGNAALRSIRLPRHLERIGAGAFRDCTGLQTVYVCSRASAGSDAFDGCGSLRCLMTMADGAGISGWTPPDSCVSYSCGLDTGDGRLDDVTIASDGVIYGTTDTDTAVLMDIPAGLAEVTVPEKVGGFPTTWVYAGALEHAGSGVSIALAAETLFPYELFQSDAFTVRYNTLACNWYLTCATAYTISLARDAGQPQALPDKMLVKAAMARAEDMSAGGAEEDWHGALDASGKAYGLARNLEATLHPENAEDGQYLFEDCMQIGRDLSGPSAENAHLGEYCTEIGAAYVIMDSGTYRSCYAAAP